MMAGDADPSKDFILLTEPYMGRRCNAGFSKKWTINHSGPNSRAIIASPPNILTTKLTQFSSPDVAFSLVSTSDCQFILGCAYFAGGEVDEDLWRPLLKDITEVNQNVLIMADTNAHSTFWGYETSDAKGEKFEEMITEGGFAVITPEYFPTFQNSRGQHSCIDIAFATSHMTGILSGRRTGLTPSISDHAVWQLDLLKHQEVTENQEDRHSFKNANWSKVNEKLRIKLNKIVVPPPEDCAPQNIDLYVDQFTNIIKEVIRKYIPRSKNRPNEMWWSPELTCMMKRVINGTTTSQDLEEAIIKSKNEHWMKFVKENSSLGDAHLRKKLASLGTKPTTPATVKRSDGTFTSTSQETATYLLNNWFRFPENDETKPKFEGFYHDVIEKLECEPVEDFLPIAEKEVLEIIQSLKTDTAPGPDNIPTIFIQNTAEVLVPYLCEIYNISLKTNHTPAQWKSGRVAIIPKPNGGYRPITLLSVFVKILEKIILIRMQKMELIEGWMSPDQFAFRPGRSTNHALLNYTTAANDYIKNKTANCVVHLDIKGAFDNVWAPILLKRLEQVKCPIYLRRWIADYLSMRKQHVIIDKQKISVNVQKSTPQGGSLSPLFWNLMIDPLLRLLKPSVDIIQAYADDIVFGVTASSWDLIERKTNSILETVQKWMDKMRLAVNPEKSSVIAYTTRRKPTKLNIKYNGQRIAMENRVKYLGITFQRTLAWTAHITNSAAKAMKALNYLTAIVNRNWGIQGVYVASLYKAAVEPIITYGALAWCNAVTKKTLMKPLQRVQRLAARMAACTNNKVQHLDLLNVVGFLPIEQRIQELAHTAWSRGRSTDDDPLNTTISRIPRLKSLSHFSAVQQLQLWDEQMGLYEGFIQRESAALKCKMMRDTPDDLIDKANHNTTSSGIETAYYTDGSKTEDGTGAAFVKLNNGEIADSWTTSLHEDSTVYQAELIAIEAALMDAENSLLTREIRIYSDSLSAIQSLSRPNKDKRIESMRRRLIRLGRYKDIKIGWVKAHAGTKGNEIADQLAKIATTRRPEMPALPASLSQVKLLIKKKVNEDWQSIWLTRMNSWTFNWLPRCNRVYKCPLLENHLVNAFNSFITNTAPLRGKLHQWKIINSPDCHYHPGFSETPRHVLFVCSHHETTRNELRNLIREATGTSDLTFKNIIGIPSCVHSIAENICIHLNDSKPLINRLLNPREA